MTIYFNYIRKIFDFFPKKMHVQTQLKPFYDRGFRPLKTMSIFWSNNNTIASIANQCSVDNWVEHENMFVLVHELNGFLGYFQLKRFVISEEGTSLSGLSFVNKKNDEPCAVSYTHLTLPTILRV